MRVLFRLDDHLDLKEEEEIRTMAIAEDKVLIGARHSIYLYDRARGRMLFQKNTDLLTPVDSDYYNGLFGVLTDGLVFLVNPEYPDDFWKVFSVRILQQDAIAMSEYGIIACGLECALYRYPSDYEDDDVYEDTYEDEWEDEEDERWKVIDYEHLIQWQTTLTDEYQHIKGKIAIYSDYVYVPLYSGEIVVLDIITGEIVSRVDIGVKPMSIHAYQYDGYMLFFIMTDKGIVVTNKDLRVLGDIRLTEDIPLYTMTISPDGKYIAAVNRDDRLYFIEVDVGWSRVQLKKLTETDYYLETGDNVCSLAWADDTFIVGTCNGRVKFYNYQFLS